MYTILGMTSVLASPEPIAHWVKSQQKNRFWISIGYTEQIMCVLSSVSWCILMREGISFLTPFLPQSNFAADSNKETIPSWSVDWRVTARALHHDAASCDS